MMIALPSKGLSFAATQRERADKLRAQHGVEAQPWYRITNAADPDEAELLLYDEIGGWWGCTAEQMIADLRGITSPNIRVRVNSPGGSVFEGIAIANALRSHPANVTVQVDGIAASIASVIAMAGDRIEMAPNTMMMIHDASGLCYGNASDMEELAELLDLISDNIADAYAARAGGTRDEWRARMKAETWYLPDDAVENGLADEAIQAPKAATPAEPDPDEDDEPDMERAWDLAAYGYTGPAKPEAPKPGPLPAAAPAGAVTLTFPIGSAVDETLIETLRAAVQQPGEPVAEAPAAADAPAVEPETPPDEPVIEADPADEWAAAVAHLTEPKPDPWADAFAHLTNPTASSSAATEA